jgi:uroporphyrinogen decarboxylase
MNSRERLKALFARQSADRCGLWLGNPDYRTWPLLFDHFRVREPEALRLLLHDDFRWINPQWTCYRHPEGRGMYEIPPKPGGHGAPGPLADCESVNQIDAFPWPELRWLDFSQSLAELRQTGDFYRASGMWSCFFHDVMALFGLEDYFVKMHTHPEVVEAATRHVCEFYLAANERFFAEAGNEMDGFFFGNDFGTQLDLFISPQQFDRFIMPWFRRFTEQGHAHGYQVILHSCGAIHRVIDRLIDARVDVLHPLQARAANMDAATLARDFKGRITFMGGIDTQDLLVNATPDAIRAEVHRVKALLGPSLVVSPSHEALLPNVPPANVQAMAEAALEA